MCQKNRRREGIRDIGSKERREQNKGGLCVTRCAVTTLLTQLYASLSMCSVHSEDVVLVSSGSADAAEQLIYTQQKLTLLPACLGRRTMETRCTITV